MMQDAAAQINPGESARLIPAISPAAFHRPFRAPWLLLITSAAVWLVVSSVFAMIASIKFHGPNFLADAAWLTYGRVRPVWFNALVYGFCLQAGLAIGMWLVARLGQRRFLGGLVAFTGAVFWNIGVTIGTVAILAGGSTGFETMEMPGYAAVFLFIGWVLIAIPALVTFHYRAQRSVFPSLWFLVAALFWFPWIYSTAGLLLLAYPVRGVAQSVLAWWYAQNLLEVTLGALGIAAAFYFVPRFSGRPLHSRYLALFSFWILLLFSSWGGIPVTAPVPAWMPAASQAATLMTLLLFLTVALNVYQTRWGAGAQPSPAAALAASDRTSHSFILFGMGSFLLASLMGIVMSWLNPTGQLQFTWFSPARLELQVYGFFALVMFGAAYYILPQVGGAAFYWPKLVRLHFWLAISGVVLIALPFAVGGVLQAVQLGNPNVPFMNTVKLTTHFLRVATIGELLLLAGNVLFLANVSSLVARLYRARVVPAYETATEDLFRVAEGNA